MIIIKKKIFYIILIALVGCGYEPLYTEKASFNSSIKSFKVEGDKNLNRKIVSSLDLKNQIKTDGYELIIKTNKLIEAVSKDDTGKNSAYITKINVKVILMEDNEEFKQKDFTSNFTYNNIENKFDFSQYQKNIEINLINGIIEEIFIFLTL